MDSTTWAIVGSVASIVAASGVFFTWRTWVLTRRMERRETSIRDIAWSVRRPHDGSYAFTNMGSVNAVDVSLVVSMEHESVRTIAPRVSPEHSITVELKVDADLRAEAAEEDRQYEVETSGISSLFSGGTIAIPPMIQTHSLRAIVSWRYESGGSDRQVLEWQESF